MEARGMIGIECKMMRVNRSNHPCLRLTFLPSPSSRWKISSEPREVTWQINCEYGLQGSLQYGSTTAACPKSWNNWYRDKTSTKDSCYWKIMSENSKLFFRNIDLSRESTFSFLRSAGLKSEPKEFWLACQDGVIITRIPRSVFGCGGC